MTGAFAFTLCWLVLHAHRISLFAHSCTSLNLFAIRTRFTPSVRKSALPQAISLAQKHIEYIKRGLRESLKDRQEFSEELKANLQAEEGRIRHRIDKLADEYYEDKITTEFYNEKLTKWTHDQKEILTKLEALHNTEKKFYEEGIRIL